MEEKIKQDMRQVYMKGAIVVLAIACALFAMTLVRTILRIEEYAIIAAQKQKIIDDNEREYKSNMKTLSRTVTEMSRRFRFVSLADISEREGSFIQKSSDRKDTKIVEKLFDDSDKTIQGVWKPFIEYAANPEIRSTLLINPDFDYVVDHDAAILEAVAEKAGLKASTVLFWDMKKSIRWAETTLSSPDGEDSEPVKVLIGRQGNYSDSVAQFLPVTLTFPIRFDLMHPNDYQIHPKLELPLGGLYVHYYRVFTKGDWLLEYTFSEKDDPSEFNLRAVSLRPDSKISSSISANNQQFKITAPANESVFLIVADTMLIPEKMSARLATAK